jgi:hypothetical protein
MPATARPTSTENPMMCATGKATTASSRCSRAGHSAAPAACPTSARWLRATPFGRPVVPDV